MPSEPPRLNPEAARVLLRILLKAYDQLNSTSSQNGGGAE
jgi:L-asparaginase/Glu-tRNA(Gln) amidotransferase subunit D